MNLLSLPVVEEEEYESENSCTRPNESYTFSRVKTSVTVEKVKFVYQELYKRFGFEKKVGDTVEKLTQKSPVRDLFLTDLWAIKKMKKGACRQIAHLLLDELSGAGVGARPLVANVGYSGEMRPHVAVIYYAEGEKLVADLAADLELNNEPLGFRYSISDYAVSMRSPAMAYLKRYPTDINETLDELGDDDFQVVWGTSVDTSFGYY